MWSYRNKILGRTCFLPTHVKINDSLGRTCFLPTHVKIDNSRSARLKKGLDDTTSWGNDSNFFFQELPKERQPKDQWAVYNSRNSKPAFSCGPACYNPFLAILLYMVSLKFRSLEPHSLGQQHIRIIMVGLQALHNHLTTVRQQWRHLSCVLFVSGANADRYRLYNSISWSNQSLLILL